jgi:hypothetical protein
MALTQAVCTSFKEELLEAGHDFQAATGDTFNFALFRATASIAGTFGAATTNYSDMGADETSGTGYVAGGSALTNAGTSSSGTTAFCDFDNLTFSTVTITTSGGLIYNTSLANAAVCVLDFGGDKAATAGDINIQFPTPDAATAIIRLV